MKLTGSYYHLALLILLDLGVCFSLLRRDPSDEATDDVDIDRTLPVIYWWFFYQLLLIPPPLPPVTKEPTPAKGPSPGGGGGQPIDAPSMMPSLSMMPTDPICEVVGLPLLITYRFVVLDDMPDDQVIPEVEMVTSSTIEEILFEEFGSDLKSASASVTVTSSVLLGTRVAWEPIARISCNRVPGRLQYSGLLLAGFEGRFEQIYIDRLALLRSSNPFSETVSITVVVDD